MICNCPQCFFSNFNHERMAYSLQGIYTGWEGIFPTMCTETKSVNKYEFPHSPQVVRILPPNADFLFVVPYYIQDLLHT